MSNLYMKCRDMHRTCLKQGICTDLCSLSTLSGHYFCSSFSCVFNSLSISDVRCKIPTLNKVHIQCIVYTLYTYVYTYNLHKTRLFFDKMYNFNMCSVTFSLLYSCSSQLPSLLQSSKAPKKIV